MKTMMVLIKRNCKLFFKDKGMFFTSLITPAILLLLYSTFLGKVYRDSFDMFSPPGFTFPADIADGFVASQIMAAILSVSCITVAFCSNMLMVQDKANGTIKDLTISPVRSSVLSVSYYISTIISTLIVIYIATGLCMLYVYSKGWYIPARDAVFVFIDSFILVLFGTAISSVINVFIKTQGQMSAVGTIVSSGYGFICGAYMPIAGFAKGIQKVISFLPGTYGTGMIRNHCLNGYFEEMKETGIPEEVIKGMRDGTDCNLYFNDNSVSLDMMYVIMLVTIAVLMTLYIVLNMVKKQK